MERGRKLGGIQKKRFDRIVCAATSGLESGGLLKFTKLDKCVIDCCPLASSSSEVGRPSIDVDVAVQGTGSSSSSSMYCDQIITNKMCKNLSPFFNIIQY